VKRESFVLERANVLRGTLRRSVSARSLSFAGLSECSNVRKRSKLWVSDSTNDASRVARRDREGGDILRDDGAGADDDSITQGDALKNHETSPKEGLLALTVESKEHPFAPLSPWSPANRDKLYAR